MSSAQRVLNIYYPGTIEYPAREWQRQVFADHPQNSNYACIDGARVCRWAAVLCGDKTKVGKTVRVHGKTVTYVYQTMLACDVEYYAVRLTRGCGSDCGVMIHTQPLANGRYTTDFNPTADYVIAESRENANTVINTVASWANRHDSA